VSEFALGAPQSGEGQQGPLSFPSLGSRGTSPTWPAARLPRWSLALPLPRLFSLLLWLCLLGCWRCVPAPLGTGPVNTSQGALGEEEGHGGQLPQETLLCCNHVAKTFLCLRAWACFDEICLHLLSGVAHLCVWVCVHAGVQKSHFTCSWVPVAHACNPSNLGG
jgi:hypothetical protein